VFFGGRCSKLLLHAWMLFNVSHIANTAVDVFSYIPAQLYNKITIFVTHHHAPRRTTLHCTTGVPIIVGEWSLATDNCAMWLNGLNDNGEWLYFINLKCLYYFLVVFFVVLFGFAFQLYLLQQHRH